MDPQRARELLARERARILEDLAAHAPDESDDLYDAEVDAGLTDNLRAELEAVDRAEARLAAGTYGVSIESGAPIPDERLEAEPTAERTSTEQARFEREAR